MSRQKCFTNKGNYGAFMLVLRFLRASARGAERVNGSYRQNQKDEGGGGMVSKFMEHFVKFLITLIIIGLDQLY